MRLRSIYASEERLIVAGLLFWKGWDQSTEVFCVAKAMAVLWLLSSGQTRMFN